MVLFSVTGSAQIIVTPNQTALQLAQKLTGTGVTVSGATLNCPTNASGIFSRGVIVSNLGIDSGIIMTTGLAATSSLGNGTNGPQTLNATNSNGGGSDANLATLSGQPIEDACILEFDFVPAGDTVKFDYAFGSEEYDVFSCSIYNDVFGFFISGPGIVGQKNIALIPGTNIAITVNSTTNPAITMPSSLTLCNSMGTGSPFSQYYVNNTTGTTVTYYGFTTVFQAISAVVPCNTYHLKLAIGDASDPTLDSGVWLKAGSLTSSTIGIIPIGSGGLTAPTPYCVRNCLPGQFVFTRPAPRPTPLTIHYLIQGTAVNGVDYTTIPDSVVIPANATSTTRMIYAQNPANGTRDILLKILSPYTCSAGAAAIIDSATLTIRDAIRVNILTHDTTICRGESVQLALQQFPGDTALTYAWTPTAGLNNPTIDSPIATPLVTTAYVASSGLVGAGCPSESDTIHITVLQPAVVNAGGDTTTCIGTPFNFTASVSPGTQSYSYSWTPATYLSGTNVLNPTFTPTTQQPYMPYVLTANPGLSQCAGSDTIYVRVLPNDFTILTPDTSVCLGATVNVRVDGHAAFTYLWTPATGVANPNVMNADITTNTSGTYTLSASYPTCPTVQHTLNIDVQPTLVVSIGPDLEKCQWDTLFLYGSVIPANYPSYSYAWTPDSNLNVGNQLNTQFSGQQNATLVLKVTTPAGCTGSDTVSILVHQGNFASVSPASDTSICPGDSVQLIATGGVHYQWSPALYLTNDTIPNPVVHPITSVPYTNIVTDQFGCYDTLHVMVTVHPTAVLSLPDTVILHPGETVQLNPQGNCLYFTWSPPGGLDNPTISNPTASPIVNTRYFVSAQTEAGCSVSDSIDVVMNETGIDVPNGFTPGSTGPNNNLKVVHTGLAVLNYFRIFNRWGNKMFETSDINQGWNGQLNGVPQPMGVYIYQVDATTASGRHFYKQGNVTLIR